MTAVLASTAAIAGTAQAAPMDLALSPTGMQISAVIEQQSPNFFFAPCSNGIGGSEYCDPSTWVINPFDGQHCAWDVDDHFTYTGSGNVAAGATSTTQVCMIADGDTGIGGTWQDHMIRARVYAPVSTLRVTLRNDQGVSIPMVAQPSGRQWSYTACTVDHTPGPYPTIASSNGGYGIKVDWQLAVTAGARAARNIYAIVDHPLIATQEWWDLRNAGCA